ncbi:hypothetical protein B0H19DRAFT_1096719 [Mycena capillaripes]|nr:hypothetical protein B0H19DRAFT_1096719 [Mycena capillaripes]
MMGPRNRAELCKDARGSAASGMPRTQHVSRGAAASQRGPHGAVENARVVKTRSERPGQQVHRRQSACGSIREPARARCRMNPSTISTCVSFFE